MMFVTKKPCWTLAALFLFGLPSLLLSSSNHDSLAMACSVCVALPLPRHYASTSSAAAFSSVPGLALTAVTRLAEEKPVIVLATLVTHRIIQNRRDQRRRRRRTNYVRLSSDQTTSSSSHENDDAVEENDDDDTDQEALPLTSAMVASIGFYKRFVSPLLPPACRFLPTCSQYGVQAIEQFGPSKGAILTAWRILRCSPLGGKGYDPPRWPPVPYTYSSY